MKKTIIYTMLFTLSFSCNIKNNAIETEKTLSKQQALKTSNTKIDESLRNKDYLAVIVSPKSEGYKDGNFIVMVHQTKQILKKYPNPEQWKNVDLEILNLIEKHKNKDYLHAAGQYISSTFLWEYLLKVKFDKEVGQKIKYYSDMMIDTESINWFVLQKSMPLFFENYSNKEKYFDYLNVAIPKDLKEIDSYIKKWDANLAKETNYEYKLKTYEARKNAGNLLMKWIEKQQN
jgi:hypothetical protein